MRRPLCLFLPAAAPEREVADCVLEVPVESFEAEAVEAIVACLLETEVELDSFWLGEGVFTSLQ